MEKLRDFSEGGDASKNSINPFDKWEEKHVQHIKNITQDRGEKLGFDVITVQFEGLKIITIMDEDLFNPLSEQPLITLPTEHPKI